MFLFILRDFQRALIMPIVTRKLTPRPNLPSNFESFDSLPALKDTLRMPVNFL